METMKVTRCLVEVLSAHGRVEYRERFDVPEGGRKIKLGRSLDADVILDDPHVAALHAAIGIDADGAVTITDLESRNGIIVAGRRQRGTMPIGNGEFKLGRTRLRVRTDGAPLAPERTDHEMDLSLVRNVSWVASISAAAWLAIVFYVTWLEAPRDFPTTFAGTLSFALAISAAWVSIWALLARMLQGEWRWLTHAAIFFGISAVVFVLDVILDVGLFALGLPQGRWRETVLIALGLALLLHLHLINVSAIRRRTALVFAGLLPILIIGTTAWVQARSQARDVNHISVREKLYPPALRLRAGIGVDEYFASAAKLKAQADEKRRALPSTDGDATDELID
jgi:hypothetical protein